MTADDQYSLLNRDNLTQPLGTQLFQKQKDFFKKVFFSCISEITLNFEHLQNRDNLTQPLGTQLFQKQKDFSQFFLAFSEKVYIKFWTFAKKRDLIADLFPKLRTPLKNVDRYSWFISKTPKNALRKTWFPFQRTLWQAT